LLDLFNNCPLLKVFIKCYIVLYTDYSKHSLDSLLCFGALCSGGQSYCVGMWTGHRYKNSILQALHAVWSLGATVGPFIIGRFLVELPPADIVNGTAVSSTQLDAAAVTLRSLLSNYSRSTGIFVM